MVKNAIDWGMRKKLVDQRYLREISINEIFVGSHSYQWI